jgi:ribose transport system substrate-binding protein
MRLGKRIGAILLVMVTILLLSACGGQPAKENNTAEGGSSQYGGKDLSDQLYIEVSALGSNPYFYDHKMGLEVAGKELGVRTEYVGPNDLDMNAVVAAIEQSIAKQPNGLIIVGWDQQLEPAMKKATDAGIPVVTVDADLPNSSRISFVGTGNYAAGRMGGEKLVELIGGKGKVALAFFPGQTNLEERASGYKDVFKEYPDIELVEEVNTMQDGVITAQNIASLLQKHPDLAGIGFTDAQAPAGATAVKEAGLEGQVKIVAMDRDNEILEGIKEGIISGSVAQQTALMPYYALQILININNSEVAITSDNAKANVLGVPNVIDTGSVFIDAENYEYFIRENI